jgi:predicted nucleotidyltransferase
MQKLYFLEVEYMMGKKGGDIDFLVQTNKVVTLKEQINILTELELNGIERKIDLLVKTPKSKE